VSERTWGFNSPLAHHHHEGPGLRSGAFVVLGHARGMEPTDDEKWLVVDGRRWRRTDPAIPVDALARLKSHLGRGRAGVRTARDEAELEATRHRTQLAKVGLGERGTPWWEQSAAERRERWESALAELDDLDA
jgi:hypothetical protein